MPLSNAQIQSLSRLLDQARDLPDGALEAWLAALPDDDRPLVPMLRRALAATADDGDGQGDRARPAWQLPALPDPDEPAGDPQRGDRVGPYRLIEEIGRGGMGSVWRAERVDGLFEREVAVKLPRLSRSEGLAERMAGERRIGARLEHPHIARLYDAGLDEQGRPYLVMELVHGHHLCQAADALRLPVRARVGLMLQVCDAVAHAHRHLVVHRDLKPSNILVDTQGQVKLLDFGVARLLQDEGGAPSATLSDARTHTPLYAAPEQLAGEPITLATDVYALGVVLYELLTGAHPFGCRDATARMLPDAVPTPLAEADIDADQPARRGAASLSALRREFTPELDAVLRRALHRDPAARYGGVDRLADDLRAWLGHRLPAAAPRRLSRAASLFLRRHRVAASAAALALGGVVLAVALVLGERGRTREQEARLAQVREFMLTTFTDTEPAAGQPPDGVTGVQMLASALERARASFGTRPSLRAEVFGEIAVMFRRFDRPAEALALLREAQALMQAHAAADDPARHAVAAQLALELLAQAAREGDTPAQAQVRPLAESALAGCGADSERCAKARATAQAALRNLATAQGDNAGAIAAARRAVAESDRAFGRGHAESAMARVQWAVALRNDDRLAEADAALAEAAAVAEGTPLRAADASELHLVQALLQADLGRHAQAIASLQALLGALRADAPDAALLHRLLAQSQAALGLLPAALQAADTALDAARRHDDGWEVAAALAVRTRSLAALGQAAGVPASLEAWRSAVAALGLPPSASPALALRRGEAEWALRQGRANEATSMLEPLTGSPAAAADAAPLDRALAWDLLAAAHRQARRWDAALAAHAEADRLRAATLPASHPLRLRNAVEQALVRSLRADPGSDDALRAAAGRYLEALPAASAWRSIVGGWIANPAGGAADIL